MKIYKIVSGYYFTISYNYLFQQVHHFSLKEAFVDYAKTMYRCKNAILDVKLQQQVNREVTGTAYPQLSAKR